MMKKTVLVILLCVCLLTTNTSYAAQSDEAKIVLSEMTEEECIAFLEEQGLSIPEELRNYDRLGRFVKETIAIVEKCPDYSFPYNYYVTLDFANEIKRITNAYYGNRSARVGTDDSMYDYQLEFNETVGVWEDTFLEYNCYAYALFYVQSPTGNVFRPYPGYFSSPNEFNINDPISAWAPLTVADLGAEGYTCVEMSTSYDEIMDYSDTHKIICLRKGHHADFHFMRLQNNSWYHKPGRTHILRYLLYRPDLRDWTTEYSIYGINYPPVEDEYFTGTIYYFAFRNGHSFSETTYTGEHNHIGTRHVYKFRSVCEHCGYVQYTWENVPCNGPPCALQYTNVSLNPYVTQ